MSNTHEPIEVRRCYETEWEGFRLVAAARPDHWQMFLYDLGKCEVVETSEWPSLETAELAAIDSAATHVFGPKHGLNLRTISAMLPWQEADEV
jgi:hypothetical protein